MKRDAMNTTYRFRSIKTGRTYYLTISDRGSTLEYYATDYGLTPTTSQTVTYADRLLRTFRDMKTMVEFEVPHYKPVGDAR